MKLLFPLFLLGLGAVAVPVLLHMRRQRPRRELPWSSLMFLTPAAPRLTRRRRLEHWLLLAVRCAALALLALAFARPFFSRPLPVLAAASGRRLVLLVDASASMRRDDLWAQAMAHARAVLDRAHAADRVAVMVFDRAPRMVVEFDTWSGLGPEERVAAAMARLRSAGPSWAATDLGRALTAASDALVDDRPAGAGGDPDEVALVSDMQTGSALGALRAADWPAGVRLSTHPVTASRVGNVGLAAVPRTEAAGDQPSVVRVRVSNHGPEARSVTVGWDQPGAPRQPVALPSNASRVIDLPRPGAGAGGAVLLEGDAHDFDNRLAVAPVLATESTILHVAADEGDDPKGPGYYLRRAFPATPLRTPAVLARRPGDARLIGEAARAHLIVVTTAVDDATAAALRPYLARGRIVLVALAPGDGAGLGTLLGRPALAIGEAPAGKEAVLTALDREHPLLAAFADPRFGDFTRVRFWRHRRLDERALPDARVLARFDDGAPAWLTVPAAGGTVLIMTAAWHPSDSQLALSSKFVPLLQSLLEASAGLGAGQSQFFVGDPVPLPGAAGDAPWTVRKPDGTRVALAPGATSFLGADAPGVYTLDGGTGARAFAVNVAPSESATQPLPPETMDRLSAGAAAATEGGRASGADQGAPGAAATIESQQKPWRWLVALLLVVLAAEALLGGRLTARAPGEVTS